MGEGSLPLGVGGGVGFGLNRGCSSSLFQLYLASAIKTETTLSAVMKECQCFILIEVSFKGAH